MVQPVLCISCGYSARGGVACAKWQWCSRVMIVLPYEFCSAVISEQPPHCGIRALYNRGNVPVRVAKNAVLLRSTMYGSIGRFRYERNEGNGTIPKLRAWPHNVRRRFPREAERLDCIGRERERKSQPCEGCKTSVETNQSALCVIASGENI